MRCYVVPVPSGPNEPLLSFSTQLPSGATDVVAAARFRVTIAEAVVVHLWDRLVFACRPHLQHYYRYSIDSAVLACALRDALARPGAPVSTAASAVDDSTRSVTCCGVTGSLGSSVNAVAV